MVRLSSTVVSTTLLGATLVGGAGITPLAQATEDPHAINGTYVATSDGTYATTDYAFHDEATVRSTWTITSKCTANADCTGQVSSDQGWSAPVRTEGPVWYVEVDVPNWETCPDGTSFTGHKTFMFYPSNADGVTQIGSPYLEGRDKTVGPRFACGRAKVLTVVMPFRLDKIG